MSENRKWIDENTAKIEAITRRLENSSFADVSDTTAVADDVASGKIFYDAGGVKTTGTMVAQEDVTNEVTEQVALLDSLESAVDKLPEPKPSFLQWKCDNMKRLSYEFKEYSGTSLDEILIGLDTSQVTKMSSTFSDCSKLTSIPKLNTSNVTDFSAFCAGCPKLTDILGLDLIKAVYVTMFSQNKALQNLNIINIKKTLQIGSGTTWGHLLTDESLINTAKELWDLTGATGQKLTLSTPSLERFRAIYVKLITPTEEQLAADEYLTNKMPCEVCESTDEGAMTLEAYANLKNWTIA